MRLWLLGLVLLLPGAVRANSIDNFYFYPGDVVLEWTLGSFAPVPFYGGMYALGPIEEGPLELIPQFIPLSTGQTELSVEMNWLGPGPAPFDIVFDNEGEKWNFSQTIFNVVNGQLVSFNPGNYDGVLVITDPPANLPELPTIVFLWIGAAFFVIFANHKPKKRYRRGLENEYDPW